MREDKGELTERVREYCDKQANLSSEEAESLYRQRLMTKKSLVLLDPYCKPCSRVQKRRKVDKAVAVSDIYLSSEFNFNHHTPAEVLDYSVRYRGRSDLMLADMDGLFLDEFPGIGGKHIFMVSTNGNHRTVVFSCIGLETTMAHVQVPTGNQWTYFIRHLPTEHYIGQSMLKLFKQNGLIDKMERGDDDDYVITSYNNLAGWLLPDPAGKASLKEAVADSRKRLGLIEHVFGKIDFEGLRCIRQPHRGAKWILCLYKSTTTTCRTLFLDGRCHVKNKR